MDTNDLRILVTLTGLCVFIALMLWSWRPARRQAHEDAALLPFLEEAECEGQGLWMRGAGHE
jgi:cytochrome c oxidase cbb3-type subunit IV